MDQFFDYEQPFCNVPSVHNINIFIIKSNVAQSIYNKTLLPQGLRRESGVEDVTHFLKNIRREGLKGGDITRQLLCIAIIPARLHDLPPTSKSERQI